MASDANELQNEEWFFAQLEAEDVDLPALFVWLKAVQKSGEKEQASSSAELLQETLAERGQTDDALAVLELRSSWAGDSFKAQCIKHLARHCHHVVANTVTG